MAKKSSIEWFVENLPNRLKNSIINGYGDILDVAKLMNQDEIKDAFCEGFVLRDCGVTNYMDKEAHQYYIDTYGKE